MLSQQFFFLTAKTYGRKHSFSCLSFTYKDIQMYSHALDIPQRNGNQRREAGILVQEVHVRPISEGNQNLQVLFIEMQSLGEIHSRLALSP
jgi:hypothetical protein